MMATIITPPALAREPGEHGPFSINFMFDSPWSRQHGLRACGRQGGSKAPAESGPATELL